MDTSIRPTPTDEEAAAIAAALTLLWSGRRPQPPVEESTPSWRFSGRWWRKPVAARRERPWW